MDGQLLVGTAEIDITPPVGTLLAGSLKPRTSVGVDNPLCAKAIVLEAGGHRLAYVALDLISLGRDTGGDEAVRRASAATGIPEDHKERSPFPWTYPVELSNDSLGYLITRDAWEGGGYEALTCASIFVDVSGVQLLVDRGLDLLRQLR